MKYFVTGCGGFIGSNLVDRLLKDGHMVVGYDNFVTGNMQFLESAFQNKNFLLIIGDIHNTELLNEAMNGCGFVFHLAANADVRFGLNHPHKDLEQNTISTFYVLEAMRENGIKNIAFSSTGSIYGENTIYPTPENAPFPIQTSLYGASKLACEGLIQAYCEGYDFKSWIFRFVSVLGERYSHGHLFNFYKELYDGSDTLTVYGDGSQTKSYMYVQDCLDGMLIGIEKSNNKVNIFNLGTDETIQVYDSIQWVFEHFNREVMAKYSGGKRGWVGDSPLIHLNCNKISELGWSPKYSIEDGVFATLEYFEKNSWLMEVRGEL